MNLLAKLKKQREALEAKTKEAQELFDKEAPTEEEVKKARELADECTALKADIEETQKDQERMEELKSIHIWNKKPVDNLPQPGEASIKTGKTELAGKTEIDLMTGDIVKEEGAGVLTDSQIKAVVNPDYKTAFTSYVRSRGELSRMKSKDAVKTLTEGIDEDGGFTVPPELLSGMISRDATPTRIPDLVRTVTVSRDKAKILKTNYQTDDLYASAVRVYKTAEGASATKANQPAFGTFEVDVHSFTAELSVTRELLEDSAFPIMGYLAEQLRIAYRNHAADKILNGSGVGEHHGILTRAGQSGKGPEIVKSGDASKLTPDGLKKLKFAVPEQYDQNARFVFNKKSTGLAISLFKDNEGRDLWPPQQQAGLYNGEPASLLGYRYAYEAFMPDIGSNNLPVIFGDLTGYMRVMRLGMTIEVLRELEARTGRVVILARFREGGDVAEPWRLKVQKIAS